MLCCTRVVLFCTRVVSWCARVVSRCVVLYSCCVVLFSCSSFIKLLNEVRASFSDFLWIKINFPLTSVLAKLMFITKLIIPLFSLHCFWAKPLRDQVRRTWKWSKILCQINQEIQETSKNDHNSWKVFKQRTHTRRGFAKSFLQIGLFTVLWIKWSKHCAAKISLAIWEKF